MREENETSATCHIQHWPDPGVDFFYFDQFLLHSMLIPNSILKLTLIFQTLTYWSGTTWSFLGFNPFCHGECVYQWASTLCIPQCVLCSKKWPTSIQLTLSVRRIGYCMLTVKIFRVLNKYFSIYSGMYIKTKAMSIKTNAIWQRLESEATSL